MTDAYNNEELYSKLDVAGVKSPGVVTLSGHALTEDFEVKKGKGQDGATTTRQGRAPAEFTSSHYLVNDPTNPISGNEHAEWYEFVKVLQKYMTDGESPGAVDLFHPDLAVLRISSATPKKITGLIYDGKGGATGTVTWIQYLPPKDKKSSNASGSKTAVSKDGRPDPNAAIRAERDALWKAFHDAAKKAPGPP
jgi:hypothetical protein